MTRRLIRSLTLAAFAVFATSSAAADYQQQLNEQILPLIRHNLPKAEVGIVVADGNTGNVLYEHHGFEAFTPASCAKLLPAAAALFQLGPEFRFTTSAHANPSHINNHTLRKNLYLKFSGDPSLTMTKLDKLVAKINQAGIRRIKGNVIIDDSVFQKPWYGPGWSQDDLNWYYAAPITGVILEQNAIGVNLTPNPTLGKPAMMSLAKGNTQPFATLKHKVKTVTYKAAMKNCSLNVNVTNQNAIDFTGCWPSSTRSKYLRVAMRNPNLVAKQALTKMLQKHHIQLDGKIVVGKMPKHLKQLATVQSLPLKVLLGTLLKDSNNVYAESLTKTLGQKVRHKGTFQAGATTIKAILANKANLNPNEYELFDGSGQSRYDLITPRHLVRLLFVMHNNPTLGPIYENALPESGENGTLKGRMKAFDLRGKIHAKTGTLKGVTALSGYLTTKNNHPLIFSIMINHVVGDVDTAKALQSQITSILYQLS